MSPGRTPSRLAIWALRRLLSRDPANAVLGDLSEDLARRSVDHGELGWPKVWLEWRAWQYGVAAVPWALTRLGNLARHTLSSAQRSLRSAPGATTFVVFILTLSISAGTVTFSVVDTVVLRPLPFDAAHELAAVEFRDSRSLFPSLTLTLPQFLALRDGVSALGSLTAIDMWHQDLTLDGAGEAEPIRSVRVTASLFEALRVRPLVGHVFTAANELDGRDSVVLLSYDLWQRRFGGDTRILGQIIRVTGREIVGGRTTHASLTVLGVMPKGFAYPLEKRVSGAQRPDVWTPYVMRAKERLSADPFLEVIGRLQPGRSLEQAQAQANAVAASLVGTDLESARSESVAIVPLKDSLVAGVRSWMLLALAAVLVVVLIACVNVANLQLTRAAYRARELSIRPLARSWCARF
jgi:putative ABC transport system permease protein